MMYPILYPKNSEPNTSGESHNLGLGTLMDARDIEVTEVLNGEFTLTFNYPVTGSLYNQLQYEGLVLTKVNPYSSYQLFRIRQISKPINGIVEIYAVHKSYDLAGYILKPCAYNSVSSLFSNINSKLIGQTPIPWTWWTDKNVESKFEIVSPINVRTALAGMENSILDIYQGELEFDNNTIKLWNNRGTNRGVIIRYGRNLIDFKQEESFERCYTHVFPYWTRNIYDEEHSTKKNPVYITQTVMPNNPVAVPSMTGERMNILTLDLSSSYGKDENGDDIIPTEQMLIQTATQYITDNNIGVPDINITVNFIDLAQTTEFSHLPSEIIKLGDTVTVVFDKYNINVAAEVIRTVYDPIKDSYSEIELGNYRSDLSSTIKNISSPQMTAFANELGNTKTSLEQAIDKTTQLITGNSGGEVIIHPTNETGNPSEILIIGNDNPTVPVTLENATHVWRWNQNGLGYATSYNGEYTLAMTRNGEIVADCITTGQLNANILKTGVIQSNDADHSFHFDLDSGEANIEAKNILLHGKGLDDYISVSFDDNDKPILQIGYYGNNLLLKLSNDKISFYDRDGNELAYWDNDDFKLLELNTFQIGPLKMVAQSNNSISFVGVNN